VCDSDAVDFENWNGSVRNLAVVDILMLKIREDQSLGCGNFDQRSVNLCFRLWETDPVRHEKKAEAE
jgi:hypothetical protein